MYSFFAMIDRMKYINRWGLMRSTRNENLAEHSLETAIIAHCLAMIGNKRLFKNHNAEKVALYAMYHDAPEILTGDLPTPVKYFNPDMKTAYDAVEKTATNKLLNLLPDDFKKDYTNILKQTDLTTEEKRIIKAADKISAYLKCIDELNSGNNEFKEAAKSTFNSVIEMDIPEFEIFEKEFLPAFKENLDNLSIL